MSPQEAIVVMESLEKKFRSLKWRAHCTESRRLGAEIVNAAPPVTFCEPLNHSAEVSLDLIHGRYAVQLRSTENLIRGGEASNASIHCSFAMQSYDGEVYREAHWSRPGETPPTPRDVGGLGIVAKTKASLGFLSRPGTSVVEEEGLVLGLAYMPRCFWTIGTGYPVQPLSRLMQTWLDEGKDVVVAEDIEGAWIIGATLRVGGNNGTSRGLSCRDHFFQVSYDTRKGGVVTGVRLLAPDDAGKLTREAARVEIDLQKVENEFWMPKTIKEVWPGDKLMTVTSCEDVEANPLIGDEAFRCEFPDGVRVEDHIRELYYETGKPLDQHAAHQDFSELIARRNCRD